MLNFILYGCLLATVIAIYAAVMTGGSKKQKSDCYVFDEKYAEQQVMDITMSSWYIHNERTGERKEYATTSIYQPGDRENLVMKKGKLQKWEATKNASSGSGLGYVFAAIMIVATMTVELMLAFKKESFSAEIIFSLIYSLCMMIGLFAVVIALRKEKDAFKGELIDARITEYSRIVNKDGYKLAMMGEYTFHGARRTGMLYDRSPKRYEKKYPAGSIVQVYVSNGGYMGEIVRLALRKKTYMMLQILVLILVIIFTFLGTLYLTM